MAWTGRTQCTWRKVDAAWYLSAYPLAETLLASIQADDPADIYGTVGPVFLHSPNPYFDERWYRARYPAVQEAIRAGRVESGFAHYRLTGRGKLSPHWLFDPDIYRLAFQERHGHALPEGADADPYGHFLETGQHQGLSGHFLFDPGVYTATAPYDLARRIDREGPFTTCLLQMHAGDDPTTSAVFDAGWYRARYPGAAADIARKRWLCALHHYLTNDDPSAFNPGPGFCEESYLAWHFDVAESIRRGEYRSGFEHYMRIGRRERRFFTQRESPPSSTIISRFPLRTEVFENLVLGPDWGAEAGTGEAADDGNLAPRLSTAATSEASLRKGTFVFGGTLFADMPRCLTDSLSRLWFLRERPDLTVLWQAADARIAEGDWPSWLTQLWELLGLHRHPGLFVTEPTQFERVIIPEAGLMEGCTIHHRQVHALGVHAAIPRPTQSRIWLCSHDPRVCDDQSKPEGQVAAILAERGWTVVIPEMLSLPRYLDLFTEAAVLAGSGVTMFLPMLLVETPTAALVPVLAPGAPVPLLQSVAQAKRVCTMFVVPKLRVGTGAPGAMELADPVCLADTICTAADAAIAEQRLRASAR